MIKITATRENGKIINLTVIGHANSAPEGKDLVCAAVTAVAIGGLNNLKNVKNFKIEIKEGLISVEAIEEIIEHDEIVMETLICGLKTIEEENGDFISIKKENF